MLQRRSDMKNEVFCESEANSGNPWKAYSLLLRLDISMLRFAVLAQTCLKHASAPLSGGRRIDVRSTAADPDRICYLVATLATSASLGAALLLYCYPG